MSGIPIDVRAAQIAPLRALGLTCAAIARRLGEISEKRVSEVCRLAGIRRGDGYSNSERQPMGSPWIAGALDDRLAEMIAADIPSAAIAAEFGMTKNQVIGRGYRLGLYGSVRADRKTKRQRTPLTITQPELSDVDFIGCRWIEGQASPPHPGMFCGAPVTEPGGAWCAEHYAQVYETRSPSQAAAWTPERRARHAAMMRLLHSKGAFGHSGRKP